MNQPRIEWDMLAAMVLALIGAFAIPTFCLPDLPLY
jgi:hypothetical protein